MLNGITPEIKNNRLYFVETPISGDSQTLNKESYKVGIKIKRWYHIFSKGTTIRLGNTSYTLNTNSLKKYLVKTSILQAKNDPRYQKIAFKAFEHLTDSQVVYHKDSMRGINLLHHATVFNLTNANHLASDDLKPLQNARCQLTEKSSQKDWENYYKEETCILRSTHAAVAAASSREENIVKTEYIEQLLAFFKGSFEESDKAIISDYLRTFSFYEILLLRDQVERSSKIADKTEDYIKLKSKLYRLNKEQAQLSEQLKVYDQKAQQALETKQLLIKIGQQLQANSSRTKIEFFSDDMLDQISEIAPDLRSSLECYNTSLEKYQVGLETFKSHQNEHEAKMAEAIQKKLSYAELLSNACLIIETTSDDVSDKGLLELRRLIQQVESKITDLKEMIASPPIDNQIASVEYDIQLTKDRLRLLQLSSKLRPQERESKIRSIEHSIEALQEVREPLVQQKDAHNGLNLSAHLDHAQVNYLDRELKKLQEQLDIYKLQPSQPDYKTIIKTQTKTFEEAEQHLQQTLKALKRSQTEVIEQYKFQTKELDKLLVNYKQHLREREKSLKELAQSVEQKDKQHFKKNLEITFTDYLRKKFQEAQQNVIELQARPNQLEKAMTKTEQTLLMLQSHLVTRLQQLAPPLLTQEEKDQIIAQKTKVDQDLKQAQKQMEEKYNNPVFNKEMGALTIQSFNHENAYFQAKAAQIFNIEFLKAASSYPYLLQKHEDDATQQHPREELMQVRNFALQQVEHLKKTLELNDIKLVEPNKYRFHLVMSFAKKSLYQRFGEDVEATEQSKKIEAELLKRLKHANTAKPRAESISSEDTLSLSSEASDSNHSAYSN